MDSRGSSADLMSSASDARQARASTGSGMQNLSAITVIGCVLVSCLLGVGLLALGIQNLIASGFTADSLFPTQVPPSTPTKVVFATAPSFSPTVSRVIDVRATETLRTAATQTVRVQATRTVRANASATAQAVRETVAPLEQNSSWVRVAATGILIHQTNSVGLLRFRSRQRNFIAQATFYNPYDRTESGWDYGFGFRDTWPNQQYRLYVDSLGNWGLDLVTGVSGAPNFNRISSGSIENFDTSPNGSNQLRLVVQGSSALFFANGEYIATLDVSANDEPGDVWVGTAFRTKNMILGRTTRFENFDILYLPD